MVCIIFSCDVKSCRCSHANPNVWPSVSLNGSYWLLLFHPKLWGLWRQQSGLPVWFLYSCKLKESFKGQRASTSDPSNQSCPQLSKTFYRHVSPRVGWGLQACCYHCAPNSQSGSERVPALQYKCRQILGSSANALLWTLWPHQLNSEIQRKHAVSWKISEGSSALCPERGQTHCWSLREC